MGRYQGQTDVPLDDTGRRQARALAGYLADKPIRAIYASDLRRAHETAQIVTERHSCSVQADPRLREISFGRWEGRTSSPAFGIRRSREGLSILGWMKEASTRFGAC